MKTTLFLIFFAFPLMLSAQVSLGEWAAIKPVTDSSHFNRNATLKGLSDIGILFWDQQVDATTTRLCYKDLNDPFSETKILLEQAGVQLKHPEILDLSAGTSNSDFIIFYETNESSDTDLKYIIYKPDDTQTDPAILSSLEGNDINLSIDPNSLKITWENSNKIYASIFQPLTGTFSPPACIESNGGYSPVFANDEVSYLRHNLDSTFMISKRIFENQGNWTVTDSSSTSFYGQCSGLNSCSPFFGMNKCMQQDISGQKSGIIINDGWNSGYLRSAEYNLTDPAICDYVIGVKNNMYFLAYVSDSLVEAEIFVNNPMGFDEFINISRWPGNDFNPQFIVTYIYPAIVRVNLFWESDRQGYSTIYYSYFDYIFGGTAENPKSDIFLTAVPCPFEMETTISFQLSRNADVTIYDLQGRKVKTLRTQTNNGSVQKSTWDGTNQQGSNVKAGSYIVVVNTDNETHNMIVIKK